MAAGGKFEALLDKVKLLEGKLETATAQEHVDEQVGKFTTMSVDPRVAARLRALQPCLIAQWEAAQRGERARQACGLVSTGINILGNAARHLFVQGVPFEQVTVAEARRAQHLPRSSGAGAAVAAVTAVCPSAGHGRAGGGDAAAGPPTTHAHAGPTHDDCEDCQSFFSLDDDFHDVVESSESELGSSEVDCKAEHYQLDQQELALYDNDYFPDQTIEVALQSKQSTEADDLQLIAPSAATYHTHSGGIPDGFGDMVEDRENRELWRPGWAAADADVASSVAEDSQAAGVHGV